MPMMEITGGKKLRNQTGDAVSAVGVDKWFNPGNRIKKVVKRTRSESKA